MLVHMQLLEAVGSQDDEPDKLAVTFRVLLHPTFFTTVGQPATDTKTAVNPVSPFVYMSAGDGTQQCLQQAQPLLQVFDESAQVLLYHLINSGAPAAPIEGIVAQPMEVPGQAHSCMCLQPLSLELHVCAAVFQTVALLASVLVALSNVHHQPHVNKMRMLLRSSVNPGTSILTADHLKRRMCSLLDLCKLHFATYILSHIYTGSCPHDPGTWPSQH